MKKKKEINPVFKNVGFVNYKWTDVVVDDEEECNVIARDEVKRAFIQINAREEKNPLDSWTDKFIRINHKTYAPVEVLEDRNGQMIYMPLRAVQKEAGISLGAEIKKPQVSDNEEYSDNHASSEEVTEVEYPWSKICRDKPRDPDVIVNEEIEIINKNVRHSTQKDKQDKQSLHFKSILTKQELIKLINDEIKLDKEQQINLIDIIDHASLSEHTPRDEAQNDWEKRPRKSGKN